MSDARRQGLPAANGRSMASRLALRLLLAAAAVLLLATSAHSVSAQTDVELADGEPVDGFVQPSAFAYYQIPVPSPWPQDAAGITINVTPLGDADPDLFGDWAPHPTMTSNTYRSRNWGEDTIFVPAADATGHTMLYLSVQGYRRPANFTIVYQLENPVELRDGQPQYGFVHKGGYTYFNFHAASRNSLSISISGSTKVYVATSDSWAPPSTQVLWQSAYTGAAVNIHSSDANWPANNVFHLAVTGYLTDAYFTISATLNGTATELSSGVPVTSHIGSQENAYFTYTVLESACQLSLTVSPISGDPDLYVSRTETRPNPATCPYQSPKCNTSMYYGADAVTFELAELGTYYIGVNAYADGATFSLVAQTVCPGDSYNSSATQLMDGVSQHGVLPRASWRFYSFVAPTESSDITFSLNARAGDPDMFIRADDIEPSRYSFQWASTRQGSDVVTVSAQDSRACQAGTQCRYYIYVYAYTASDFYLTASTPTVSILLNEGQPQVNTLQAKQKKFYTVSVNVRSWSTHPLYVAVTDLGSGNPDLYISRTNERPDPNDDSTYQWSAVHWSDDAVNIFPNDPNYCTGQCTYFVTVVADTATTYSIVFHMGQPTALSLGVPQQGNVPAAAYNFYAVRLTPGYQQLQLSLVVREGYANVYVSNNEEVLPNAANASTYQVARPWYTGATQLITINEGDAASCTPGTLFPRYCTYLIAVEGFTNCSYTIGAVTNNDDEHTTQLRSGIAQPGQVSHLNYQYFRFQVSAEGQDLAIVLSATSGDPDLYVSNITLPTKEAGHYNWSSSHSGGDSISIFNVSIGTYYIGVFGWSPQNSSFTIVATLSPAGSHPGGLGDIIQLQDGVQQNGVLSAGGQYLYYMISIPAGMPELFVAISKISGDPDIYMRYDPYYPTVLPVASDYTTYTWKSSLAGDDTITRPSPPAGVYTIGVLAFAQATQFSISAATGLAFQRLSDGVSRRGSVVATGYSYFSIFMDSPTDLTITVTPMSGDPDLFVTTGSTDRPNATNAIWRSTAFRDDSVTIPHNDPNACTQCFYYVGVYGFFASTFTIVANFGNEQVLQESVPVDGSVTVGGMVFYSFSLAAVSRTHGTVDLDLAALSGSASLYVSMGDHPGTTEGTYDYYGPGTFSGAHLTIDVAEACSKESNPLTGPCVMHIGVNGDWTSSYTILATVSTSTRNINLINGRAVISTLEAGQYEYYTLNVPDNEMDVIIAVQPFTGDADLYVSNRESEQQPNATHHKWESRRAGVDSVAVHNATAGLYYIGVFAYTASRYSVTAYANYENATATPIQLQDGVPTSAAIGQGDMLYYVLDLKGQHEDLEISLSSSLGDPDLYVLACQDNCRNNFPNRTHYTWSSTRFGADTITILNPAEAKYIIGVFAWATSVYSLVAVSSSSALQLVAGIPFSQDLFVGQTEYFFLEVTDVSQALTVTVTSLTGDPDLYIDTAPNTHPGPGNARWIARSYRNDSITIPASQLQRTRYYVAVNAFLNCSFTVLATFENRTMLQDGLPQNDLVLKEQSKYYTFRVQYTGQDVTFSLSPFSGYALLYVANGREPVWNDPSTYDWNSDNQFTSQLIVIPANATAACKVNPSEPDAFCEYYALVRGVSECQYSITASRGLVGQILQDGRVVQATVAAGKYQHFKFQANNPEADITFSVTPFSGNPYMYILTSPADPDAHGASQSHYQWASEMDGGDSITIPYDDPNFSLGEWHLAVYGHDQYSLFSVVASASTRTGNISMIALVDGQPLVGRIAVLRVQYKYYTFTPSDPHVGFNFALAPRSGDPDMFISMYPTIPTNSEFTWAAAKVGGDTLTINGAHPDACGTEPRAPDNPCVFVIGVRQYSAGSGGRDSSYTITVTSAMVTGQLQSGIPVYGSVAAKSYVYYSIYVPSFELPTLQVSLTAISGDADLFAARIYEKPNKTHHEWTGQMIGSEEFTIPNAVKGMYYISAYGWTNASFSLTATFGQPVILSPGQPFTDQIAISGQIKYYTIRLDVSGGVPDTGLTISVAPKAAGWIDMFLSAGGPMADPDQENGWKSEHNDPSNGRSIIVRADDPQACWLSNCTYSLAVRASYMSSALPYTVTYYFGDEVVTLMPGAPFPASVEQGQTLYFRTIVSSLEQDISISSTQNTGEVALFATQEDVMPNATNARWWAYSNDTKGSHIAIARDDKDLKFGQLLIGVYGLTSAHFSLALTTENVMLSSGMPQSASCGTAGQVQYYFLNFRQAANVTNPADYSDIIFDIGGVRSSAEQAVVSDFDMFITTDPADTKPNATSAQWRRRLHDGDQFHIKPTDKHYCFESCTYYIGVACASDPVRGQYEITASTNDALETLSVTAEPSQGQVAYGAGKFYQVYLQTATNFSFTLSPCVGDVDLYISSRYARPDGQEGHFEDVRNSHTGVDVYNYRAAPGANPVSKLFFGVWQAPKEKPSAKEPASLFEVTPAYLGQRVSTSPVLPNPELVTTELRPGGVKFMFLPAQSEKGTDPKEMVYTVYWARQDDATAILYTHCGCREIARRTGNFKTIPLAASWNAQHSIEFALDHLDDRHTYRINVLAFDPKSDTGPTAYQPLTARPGGGGSSGGSTPNKVLLGVGIPVGLFVLALVGYLCYRNRKMSKELAIEMHDVPAAALRKAARGAADPEVTKTERAKNFHKLLQEDEIDSSDMYVAPINAQRASATDEL